MTKKINKPELAILNDDFVTVTSQIFNSLLGKFFVVDSIPHLSVQFLESYTSLEVRQADIHNDEKD